MGVSIINKDPQNLLPEDWALVKNLIVMNVIFADINFINNISNQYDYIINVDGVVVDNGWTYDPIQNIFIAPIVDPNVLFSNALPDTLSPIGDLLILAQNVGSTQKVTNLVNTYIQQNVTDPHQITLWNSILNYLIVGMS